MDSTKEQIKILQLCSGVDWDAKLFSLRVGQSLRLTLAPNISAKNVQVFTDFPLTNSTYIRGQMRQLEWTSKTTETIWDPDRYTQLHLITPGPYRLLWSLSSQTIGQSYIVVEPDLGYSPNSISCHTYITKLLGPLNEWKQRLLTSVHTGYNMIHFTPPQQLGSSRSGYSISNQLRIDSSYLPHGYTHSEESVSYTDRSGKVKCLTVDSSFVQLEKEIRSLKKDHGLLSIVDVVWNHTSFDTPWLIQHPEAGYNLVNSPHLRPAYCLDVTLAQFSNEIAKGEWSSRGINPHIQSEHDIHVLCSRLLDTVLPPVKLWEYYCVDVELIVKEFNQSACKLIGGEHSRPEGKSLTICQDTQYRRLGSTVDANLTLQLFNVHKNATCFEDRMVQCCDDLRKTLQYLNGEIEDQVKNSLHTAVNNIAAHIRYQFLEEHGPKRTHITCSEPFTPRYFHRVGGVPDLTGEEIETHKGINVLAHNGWVMNADPLVNFAEESSDVYFKRELIVWDDAIKLRYGNKPSDSPWLWSHMSHYTQIMAYIFDGFRLDNCHNTPILVAEGLLDAARAVNPNLYTVAELFTPSEERDNYFVNRLGINCLIREAMSADTAHELGRLVYRFGGDPVASFFSSNVLKPSVAKAMFIDATHDNEPGHIQSRSVYDSLPNTALVSVSSCATGGCRGYDELIPHKIDVVTEKRPYSVWSNEFGIMKAKRLLNSLHKDLSDKGYSEIYVDQVTHDIVAVTRHCPAHHKSFVSMAHTCFYQPPDWATPTSTKPITGFKNVPPLTIQGHVKEIYMEARIVKDESVDQVFVKDDSFINGLNTHVLECAANISINNSKMCQLINDEEIAFNEFSPGSFIIFEVELSSEAVKAVQVLRSFLTTGDKERLWSRFTSTCVGLSLIDMNYILYRCDAEERDEGKGGGVYDIPNYGTMTYCGLQGIISMMKPIRDNNDLGHSLCDNLRSGNWLLGYTAERLKLRESTKELGDVLSDVFHYISLLPRYLVPSYFDAVITSVYNHLLSSSFSKMSKFVSEGSQFIKGLSLGSIQLYGDSPNATYPSYNSDEGISPVGSLAAGLPHFSTGFMRCWGRDTFIALRGLLLVTGRYEEARDTILAFGACLRHGLIPNLLSGGRNPRYNCRDATWWWLQSIQDYMKMAPDGKSFLQSTLKRIFSSDDSQPDFTNAKLVTLAEVIQDSLQRHASGISFTERGAGPGLDRDMTPPGFLVTVSVDWEGCGFVKGGNQFNCGTWMDKVGESSWAGNKGIPATPRDGSAIELVGLSYSSIKWLSELNVQGLYPFNGVYTTHAKTPGSPFITFTNWAQQIKDNFESKFWIPADRDEAIKKEGSDYLHRTGIYKDTYGSTHKYTDYQLRPNLTVAMVVAPQLFTPSNALLALEQTGQLLLGPLGMKTLDPDDWQYNGYYINSVDSNNYKTAKGFNYHQGPEWLWVIGYYLRARLIFDSNKKDAISSIHQILSNHAQALQESQWSGLPELTNQNGADCLDSCPVQAWSMSALLDVLYDVHITEL